jgi:peroxiredoxin
MKMKKLLNVWLSLSLLVLLLLSGCASSGNAVGDEATDFKLQNLEGQSVSLSELRGKPVMLNFWATWCGPCRNEMPYLQQIYDEWQDKGLVLLEINMSESSSTVQQFLTNNGYTFPVYIDTDGSVADTYGISGIPTTFFIDSDGVIQQVIRGSFPSKAAIETQLYKIMP